jgi:hypothetical protein
MRFSPFRWTAVAAAVALIAGAVMMNQARSQINASPSWVPIGVSTSGSTSTAWFHEPSSRQALACQTKPGPDGNVASIHCVAARLP